MERKEEDILNRRPDRMIATERAPPKAGAQPRDGLNLPLK